jgi:L-aminopeptidase/D-esterase-like protein
LLPHQLKRLARRVTVGLARVGGMGANSSGDLFLAFSTATTRPTDQANVRLAPMLDNDVIDPFFTATAQATEEAIVNALIAAETMTGINGNKVYALPEDRLLEVLRKHGRLKQ